MKYDLSQIFAAIKQNFDFYLQSELLAFFVIFDKGILEEFLK